MTFGRKCILPLSREVESTWMQTAADVNLSEWWAAMVLLKSKILLPLLVVAAIWCRFWFLNRWLELIVLIIDKSILALKCHYYSVTGSENFQRTSKGRRMGREFFIKNLQALITGFFTHAIYLLSSCTYCYKLLSQFSKQKMKFSQFLLLQLLLLLLLGSQQKS